MIPNVFIEIGVIAAAALQVIITKPAGELVIDQISTDERIVQAAADGVLDSTFKSQIEVGVNCLNQASR